MRRQTSLITALDQELHVVAKREAKLFRAAASARKSGLEEKIPPKVRSGLEAAFTKAFTMLLSPSGRSLIERSYDKGDRHKDFRIRNYAVELKGRRQEIRQMHRAASQTGLRNMALTTVEGVGLGALGIGLPDIVLFLAVLLKGIYETALNYGFEYETPSNQLLILKMMEAALSHGERRDALECEVDSLLLDGHHPQSIDLQAQTQNTVKTFVSDMLLLKFVQGLPVIGIVGGMGNPLYYHRILEYVQLKYRKGYLLRCRRREELRYPDLRPANKSQAQN